MQKKTRVCTSLVDGVPKCPGTNIQKRVCNSQKCPGNLHNGFLFVFSVLEAPRASRKAYLQVITGRTAYLISLEH